MEEVSILIIKEIAELIFKKPCKTMKISDSNYVKEVLTYISRNLLNILENCIKLLPDRI